MEKLVAHGDTLLTVSELLPHRAMARLGCATCPNAVTIEYRGVGCAIEASQAYQAADIAEVPVTCVTLQNTRTLSGDCEGCAVGITNALELLT